MVAQQHFQHRLARLLDLVAVGGDDHALADHRGAGGLQLGHLLDFHQAHAASALQREVGVIAERGHFDAHGLAGLNEQRARGSRELLAVDSESYVSHKNSVDICDGRLQRFENPESLDAQSYESPDRPMTHRLSARTCSSRQPFQTGTACRPDDLQILF